MIDFARFLLQVHVDGGRLDAVGALSCLDASIVVDLSIRIRVSHSFSGSEAGHHLACARRGRSPGLVKRAFHVATGSHAFVVLVKLDPVSLDEVVVLPSPGIHGVNRDAHRVLSIGSLGGNEYRRLCILERSRVVSGLAAIVRGAHVASRVGFVPLSIVIYLIGLGTALAVPNHRTLPAKIEDLFLTIVDRAFGDGVSIALVVLEAAVLAYAIYVLRVLKAVRSCRLAGRNAKRMPPRSIRNGRFDFDPHTVPGVEGLYAIAIFVKQSIHPRRAYGFLVGTPLGSNRGNGHDRFACCFSKLDVFSIREEL